jgi:long-chain fatty acid transport protein
MLLMQELGFPLPPTLKMVDITPAISYRPSDAISLGLGVDYFKTIDADLQRKVPVDVINAGVGFPTSGAPDANSKLSGDGSQWGYHAGLLYKPASHHTIGVAYHSEVKTKIEGDLEITGLSGASASAGVFGGTDYKTSMRTDLFYPQHVQFGYKYSQGDKWETGFNLAWYDWSSNKELAINLPNATATQKALAGNPIPLHWRDVWSVSVGGFYRFNESWKLNGGMYYIPAVYPESTFSPAVPDMNKIGLSIGPSYTKNSWSIDTVYNPIFYKTTTINNTSGQSQNGGLAAADISGEYKAMIHIVGVNVRYNFR